MARFRVVLVPRSPVQAKVIVETIELPKFQGGAVIVTQPIDVNPAGPGPHPGERPPSFMVWPLDTVSAVLVDELPDRDR